MFPEELPKRLIKMFSFVGETVFDPFLGSGTTALAAGNLGRNSIGYEINRKFQPIIADKLGCPSFLADTSVTFTADEPAVGQTYPPLPYVFHDPHAMDKKIDVKKLQFGSRIDQTQSKRDDLFSVMEIISPAEIVLSNGLHVRLLGVREKSESAAEAMAFLREKFQKRKVFLRYDASRYDAQNRLMCYVYLDNKTFINNHLIRTGYVDVDQSLDYSCKNKFLSARPR